MDLKDFDVSIITPIYNGECWIDDCFESILKQDAVKSHISIEICVYNDGSTDRTMEMLQNWQEKIFAMPNFCLQVKSGSTSSGVGYAKNRAVEASRGKFLCFQDVDDIMETSRISKQLITARENENSIVGCRFRREPEGSTTRFTNWANNLSHDLLNTQVYTSHGPTVIMPTWFCSRQVFDRVGGFSEDGPGTPEDLIFFYKHLDIGGHIIRIDEPLLIYRFHPLATTFSIKEETIWKLRLQRLEDKALPRWNKFAIWNAGKQGRKLWRSLSPMNQQKVSCLCDVDLKKIGKFFVPFSSLSRTAGQPIPICYFRDVQPPFVICVKLDLTNGDFEKNLLSLNLQEGVDYVLFS